MSIDYDAIAAELVPEIKEAGQSVGVTRYKTSKSLAAGSATRTVDITGSITALVLPASQGTIKAFDNRLEKGALVEARLRYVLAAAADAPLEPKYGDELDFEGATWLVLGCTPVAPAGIPLVYRMGVKRI